MDLKQVAKDIRCDIVSCIASIGSGHIGGCLSIVEVLTLLYFKYMRIDPTNPQLEARDRFVLSKGHAGPALYATLANRGYFDKAELCTLNKGGTHLPSHCDMNKTVGVDMTAGSLGQGFGCACGMALGSKLDNDGALIYSVIGDGESQEGSIWEAAMFAAHQGLDNLIAFTDSNKLQLDGTVSDICELEPLDKKWQAFNWNVIVVEDGNSLEQVDCAIVRAIETKNGKPTMIILNTVKGKGVSFVEAKKVGCHSMPISKEDEQKAIEEIRRAD